MKVDFEYDEMLTPKVTLSRSHDEIESMVEATKLALEDKKGLEVQCMPVAEQTVLADYFLVASAESVPHVRALADSVEEKLEKDFGARPAHREGVETARWILLDYLDFVVHIFHQEERQFYQIEKLWDKARKVEG